MVDPDRLLAAFETARCDLLAETTADGHWTGNLSSSALSTATAVSALAIVERHAPTASGRVVDEPRECALSQLIMRSLRWLARHQNPDGGWGDTDLGGSNLAATLLVRAAFALTCTPADHPGMLERADAYIAAQGGVKGFHRRYGRDNSFVAAVLANCAFAGIVPWNQVPTLPFELVGLPRSVRRFLRLPAANIAAPALVAIGQAKFFHMRPINPIARWLRKLTLKQSLAVVESLQPESGGFLEAVPLTSFVTMSLAATDREEHPIVRNGVEFLLANVRPDGSWPITTNLATRNTILAAGALAASGEDLRELNCLDWILACQHRGEYPDTPVESGGWSWTSRSGGVPNSDDTAGALLALADWAGCSNMSQRASILLAAKAGVHWLLDLQNTDGGWPTFARGTGTLIYDQSASDLTAHALRALHAWRGQLFADESSPPFDRQQLDARIALALEAGLRHLIGVQQRDGAWAPLWVGSPYRSREDNPLWGTAKVLLALRDLDWLDSPAPHRALDFLASLQRADGSFGASDALAGPASVEETALAVETLLTCGSAESHEQAALRGLKWLVDAVEANRHTDCAPLGLFFARLWYYEKLTPLIASTGALGQAVRKYLPTIAPRTVAHSANR